MSAIFKRRLALIAAGIVFAAEASCSTPAPVSQSAAEIASACKAAKQFQKHPSGRELAPGFYQLTGTHLCRGQTTHRSIQELPDPAPPYVNDKGQVEIYGSGPYFLRYKNWQEFTRGGEFEMVPLDVRYPSGQAYNATYTHPWDLRKFRIETAARPSHEVLLGGSMSPTGGRPEAVWPDDNINRRVFAYDPNGRGQWIRRALPEVGEIGSGWLGHSYGGNYFQASSPELNVLHAGSGDPIYLFYERVSDAKNGGPFKTELFMREMKDIGSKDGRRRTARRDESPEIKILGVGEKPWPSTARTVGGYLVEGPRPIRMVIEGQEFFIVGFSSGDFPTDSYTVNYAWSRKVTGPYTPMLNEGGTDLLDLGQKIKKQFRLSWVGRPSFFRTPEGGYEMLFHGVFKDVLPDNDYSKWPTHYELWEFFRCLFKVKLKVSLGAGGVPVIVPAI